MDEPKRRNGTSNRQQQQQKHTQQLKNMRQSWRTKNEEQSILFLPIFVSKLFVLVWWIFGLDDRPTKHTQTHYEMDRKRWRRKRKRHSREIETTRKKWKKSAHNKMICYTPVAYGIRKIDCFLIIKTREAHIHTNVRDRCHCFRLYIGIFMRVVHKTYAHTHDTSWSDQSESGEMTI